MKQELAVFEGHEIRRHYDEATETWWFSVVDIIRVLTQSDYQAARKYWKVLKGRLAKEGSQLVTNCYQLKMTAEDGKQRPTDAATAETLLRLVQSVPSPKAEPIKLWLAKVGYERMQEMADPARSLARAREAGGVLDCGRNPDGNRDTPLSCGPRSPLLASAWCGRKRCRRYALPPQSKTLSDIRNLSQIVATVF